MRLEHAHDVELSQRFNGSLPARWTKGRTKRSTALGPRSTIFARVGQDDDRELQPLRLVDGQRTECGRGKGIIGIFVLRLATAVESIKEGAEEAVLQAMLPGSCRRSGW